MIDTSAQGGDVDVAADDRILEVVNRVADVVGEVHHLRLDAAPAIRGSRAQPLEHLGVVVVEAVLAAPARVGHALRGGPRVLAAGIEARPGEVEAHAAAVGPEGLRLDAGEQPQGLRVAFETADVGGPVVERALAVVTERRMPEVVREARGVDHIGVEPQGHPELTADLRDLEGVRQAIAGEVEPRGRAQHLRLRGEAPQGARVQNAGPVAGEIAAAAGVLLGQPAFGVDLAVAGRAQTGRVNAGTIRHWCSTPPR